MTTPRPLTETERSAVCQALEDREALLRTTATGAMERNPESVINALIHLADECEELRTAFLNGEVG